MISGDAGGCGLLCGDAATPTTCTNLQCQASACATSGKPETTLTGTVYDPAANLALYNVYVYIPNATPDAIHTGDPTCTQCAAPATGSPIIGALTDSNGKFTLQKGPTNTWGVPSGDNIPLVLQIGKWRRQVVIPHIDACTTVDLDTVLGKDVLRLPKKSSEGDMPLIAFTSGCDPAECFLRKLGIDDSEFVPPGSTTGHVHFYTGKSAWNSDAGTGSTIAGGNTAADTYNWWTSSANLLKYDIVFNACECSPFDRGAAAYDAMHTYLDSGGRLFGTHYYYNWFAPPTGPTDFQGLGAWTPDVYPTMEYEYDIIDTTFPKGKAFGDWLLANGAAVITPGVGTTAYFTGQDYDLRASGPPQYPQSTRWIFAGDALDAGPATVATSYMSFNTPVKQPTAKTNVVALFSVTCTCQAARTRCNSPPNAQATRPTTTTKQPSSFCSSICRLAFRTIPNRPRLRRISSRRGYWFQVRRARSCAGRRGAPSYSVGPILAMRFAISSEDTSSLCVEIAQMLPALSFTIEMRSP